MIVMHPNQVTRPIPFHYRLAKEPVGLDICVPGGWVEFQLRGKVVEHRPQSLVGIALIKSHGDVGWQLDGKTSLLLCPFPKNGSAAFLVVLLQISRPAEPVAAAGL